MKAPHHRLVAAGALGLAGLLAACGNMKDQPNPRTLVPTAASPAGASARPWPAHLVARGEVAAGSPFETGRGPDGQPLAQAPLRWTVPLLARGRDRFDIYCAACHGGDGYGTGIVVRRGFPPPPSYHDLRLRREPDGQLFDAMTRGYGVMPSFADRLTSADRWAIVGYIRALQRSQHATLADVPADERAALGQP